MQTSSISLFLMTFDEEKATHRDGHWRLVSRKDGRSLCQVWVANGPQRQRRQVCKLGWYEWPLLIEKREMQDEITPHHQKPQAAGVWGLFRLSLIVCHSSSRNPLPITQSPLPGSTSAGNGLDGLGAESGSPCKSLKPTRTGRTLRSQL